LISHRAVPANEIQVDTYPPFICTQSPVLMNSNLPVNTGYIQEIVRIYIEEDCCFPSTTMNCVSDSYVG
jgi:hypothetical protein